MLNLTLLSLMLMTGCETPDCSAAKDAGGWGAERAARAQALDRYLADNAVAYRWFADFPFGTSDGVPYLILRSLPLIAPEEWGTQKNFLSVVGLFHDERNAGYPIARGVGWSGMGRKPDDLQPDYASFACGACHVGRVRKNDGSIMYLDGGINSEFNLVAYRVKVGNTIKRMIGNETNAEKKVARATAAILKAIDTAHKKDPTFFYANYTLGNKRFGSKYEAQQIELFKKDAASLVGTFLVRADLELRSLVELVNKNYKGFEGPMLHGFGGMADATGVSTSFSFVFARDIQHDPHATPQTRLPPAPGLTDFMAVWEQGKRQVQWNPDKTDLINGGGQWNGNIPIPVYRNMAAELTLGYGAKTDVRIAALSEGFLRDLPAPPYPFDVDMELAKKGKTLFKRNCADCHRPHNGRVYKNIGTDLSRAYVVSPRSTNKARVGFSTIGFPNRVVVLPPDDRKTTPFKVFRDVPLQDKTKLLMRDPTDCEGYNALPLGGIWAQAPYLHAGSVPTLFHLLVPEERPNVFRKSCLNYDTQKVGFEWRAEKKFKKGEGYRFDTTAFPTVSKRGHDKDIYENGTLYKLDWSGDRDGVKAIIEYMKTL